MVQVAIYAPQIFLGGGQQFSGRLLLLAHLLAADVSSDGGVGSSPSRICSRMGNGHRSIAGFIRRSADVWAAGWRRRRLLSMLSLIHIWRCRRIERCREW